MFEIIELKEGRIGGYDEVGNPKIVEIEESQILKRTHIKARQDLSNGNSDVKCDYNKCFLFPVNSRFKTNPKRIIETKI